MLRDYVVGGEPRRGSLELLEAELTETRPRISVTFAPIFEIGGFENGGLEVGVEPAERELGATGSHWVAERLNGGREREV